MADVTADEQLLIDVKAYLHITWQDENTDKNITDAINSSKARLQYIAGVPLDFTKDYLARDLLKDRCRYINSQALEMFEINFASELLELSLEHQFETPEKLTVISAAGTSTGYTDISTSPQLDSGDSYMYKLGTGLSLPGFFDTCDTVNGFIPWNGISEIEAITGNDIVVVEVDEGFKAIRAGKTDALVR